MIQRRSALRGKSPGQYVCEQCGCPYTAKNDPRNRFCSPECKIIWRDSQRYARICKNCGKCFQATRNATLCSPECRDTVRIAALRAAVGLPEGQKPKGKGHRARCLRFGGSYDPAVTREKVLDRDGWVCQICGGDINPQALTSDPCYGTLDHVVPLSSGADHSWANVQAAHARCNGRKGPRRPRILVDSTS